MSYEDYAKIAKALSEPKRVKILDMLSCGKMCACDILEHFDFTQPTLSHHIKILVEAGLVTSVKNGTWHYYSNNEEVANQYIQETVQLLMHSDECICNAEGDKDKSASLSCDISG
ncbi:metalloregulator ArsR/SmtB family transcription factor [Carnobacterium sp. ISL-102]|uniref:ArsR/SmtB family transcription factor n=1 Tax=Carnobacterium sp. ISL-102 TaxID=2819142 RepID=UPI001BE72E4B|nr:metalloregulator ArsR/SmtB family transcription factor [Carnobacterium sp. ISL-102]MBT2731768.1 winged helix-turn-helix transcriptional regulator [Carnobacterium sp. ISL-102]